MSRDTLLGVLPELHTSLRLLVEMARNIGYTFKACVGDNSLKKTVIRQFGSCMCGESESRKKNINNSMVRW